MTKEEAREKLNSLQVVPQQKIEDLDSYNCEIENHWYDDWGMTDYLKPWVGKIEDSILGEKPEELLAELSSEEEKGYDIIVTPQCIVLCSTGGRGRTYPRYVMNAYFVTEEGLHGWESGDDEISPENFISQFFTP